MSAYIAEEWSDDEADVLRRYFTNLDQPVFALDNLPEVVKGALFARYSRSAKSLRRLFLDEFLGGFALRTLVGHCARLARGIRLPGFRLAAPRVRHAPSQGSQV